MTSLNRTRILMTSLNKRLVSMTSLNKILVLMTSLNRTRVLTTSLNGFIIDIYSYCRLCLLNHVTWSCLDQLGERRNNKPRETV